MDEKMMLFLGTGAAEGIPTPFCRCRVCENARKKGGKEVRMRSGFRVSRELLIDFGPDLFAGCVKTGTDLYDLKYLLITHTHEDHLDIGNLFLNAFAYGILFLHRPCLSGSLICSIYTVDSHSDNLLSAFPNDLTAISERQKQKIREMSLTILFLL